MQPAQLSPRFTVRRRIGSGGFGAVFDVLDHARDARVALKKLTRLDAGAVYRFKREFRALADVTHPNLVRLHELVSIGEDWYITMDLVEGVDFRSYVRGVSSEELEVAATTVDSSTDSQGEAHEEIVDTTANDGLLERLRGAVAQLAAGVHALHQAGKLHRDLKPSNVLVTPAGRLTILDFGLVTSLDRSEDSMTLGVRGTPAYMSPEQAAGHPGAVASDWYSVGVMLYEALRGRLPFAGSARDMISAKRLKDATDPRVDRPDLPADLCDLAMALLRRDPADRPTGLEIIKQLGLAVELPVSLAPPRRDAGPFVGREAELAALRAAAARAREKKGSVVVQVHGPPGSGKTALVRRFLDELAGAASPALIFEGRCHERESVPYKAFDGILDALAGWMARLSDGDSALLVPRDAPALARLFPTFTRGGTTTRAASDVHELRRRAFAALREILTRLAERAPLVLFLDDVQWGDLDSAALLVDLLAPPDPPALLLVACHRSEDAERSSFLRALSKERARGAGGDTREIAVGALGEADALRLASELCDSEETAGLVARESGGNPLVIAELAYAGKGAAPHISLAELLGGRIAALPEASRELLELVALAGRPLPYEVARRAAAVDPDALAELRAARLIRLTSAHERQTIETFSNRVREIVVAGLSADAIAALHRRLAAALEAAPDADPEALAVHLFGSGDAARAWVFAERAGDRAADVLAFDHAVGLFRRALDEARGDFDAQRLRIKLADALASAGRGVEAARIYLEARDGEIGDRALTLSRRAGEQLLRSGHIDEGLDVLGGVLASVGLDAAPSPRRALASLRWHRLRLRLRGLGFRERPAKDVPYEDLARIDVCWSVGNGLGGVDLVRGADFQARHLLAALKAGEPYRIARALAWDALLCAFEGGPRRWKRAGELAEQAEGLAERIDHPHALAWAMSAAAVAAWSQAQWRRAATLCEFATALFRERCVDIAWEVASLEIWFNLPSLFFLGDLRGLERRAAVALEDAEARGDRYARASLAYMFTLGRLAAGRPDEARDSLDEARRAWSAKGWHMQHWAALMAEGNIALYQGRGAAALAAFDEAWPRMAAARQLAMQNLRIQTVTLRGRLALDAGQRERALAAARRLERERTRLADAYALLLRAGASTDGELFERAAGAFAALSMTPTAAAARRRRAELDRDTAAVAAADAALAATGAVDAERLAALLAPRASL